VARTCCLAEETVKMHLKHIYQKLRVHSRLELAARLELAIDECRGASERREPARRSE